MLCVLVLHTPHYLANTDHLEQGPNILTPWLHLIGANYFQGWSSLAMSGTQGIVMVSSALSLSVGCPNIIELFAIKVLVLKEVRDTVAKC